MATVSDKKIPVQSTIYSNQVAYYKADIVSTSDYYPFGQELPGRCQYSNEYRYGFNGKENIDEMYGATGTFQDYGFRMYDPRVCRFISVDPITKQYPELTPYQFSSNSPIWMIDLDGLEGGITVYGVKSNVESVVDNDKKHETYTINETTTIASYNISNSSTNSDGTKSNTGSITLETYSTTTTLNSKGDIIKTSSNKSTVISTGAITIINGQVQIDNVSSMSKSNEKDVSFNAPFSSSCQASLKKSGKLPISDDSFWASINQPKVPNDSPQFQLGRTISNYFNMKDEYNFVVQDLQDATNWGPPGDPNYNNYVKNVENLSKLPKIK